MSQIVNTSDASKLNSGHILESSHPNHDDIVLLKVVAFSGHVGNGLSSARQSDKDTLPVGRIRLFGLFDDRFYDDSLGSTHCESKNIFVRSERNEKFILITLHSKYNVIRN